MGWWEQIRRLVPAWAAQDDREWDGRRNAMSAEAGAFRREIGRKSAMAAIDFLMGQLPAERIEVMLIETMREFDRCRDNGDTEGCLKAGLVVVSLAEYMDRRAETNRLRQQFFSAE